MKNLYIFLLSLILIPYSYAQEAFDFTLDANTKDLTIIAGGFETIRLLVTSNSDERINLNAYGLPDDVGRIIFFPTTARAPSNVTMTVSTFDNIEGNYTIIVEATAKNITKSIEIDVRIINIDREQASIEGIEEVDIEGEDISADFDYEISIEPNISTVSIGDVLEYNIAVEPISGEPQEVQLEAVEIEGLETSITPTSGIPPFTSTLNVRIVNATSEDTIIMTVTAGTEDQSKSAVAIIDMNNAIVEDNTPKDVMLVAALISIPIVVFVLTKTGVIKVKRN